MSACSPAPASTTTSTPLPCRRLTTSGTSATRRSPSALSLGTPTFMRGRNLSDRARCRSAPGGQRHGQVPADGEREPVFERALLEGPRGRRRPRGIGAGDDPHRPFVGALDRRHEAAAGAQRPGDPPVRRERGDRAPVARHAGVDAAGARSMLERVGRRIEAQRGPRADEHPQGLRSPRGLQPAAGGGDVEGGQPVADQAAGRAAGVGALDADRQALAVDAVPEGLGERADDRRRAHARRGDVGPHAGAPVGGGRKGRGNGAAARGRAHARRGDVGPHAVAAVDGGLVARRHAVDPALAAGLAAQEGAELRAALGLCLAQEDGPEVAGDGDLDGGLVSGLAHTAAGQQQRGAEEAASCVRQRGRNATGRYIRLVTVNLTRIYTGLGDGGETHLGDMSRVPKTHPRIEAYGAIDELNALVGLALTAEGLPERYAQWLRRVQNDLFDLGADLSVPEGGEKKRLRVAPEQVTWLEQACDEVNATLEPLKSFVLPGGSVAAAHLHVCRTVGRRAERRALAVQDANPEGVRYLNRLSDLLFILSRGANAGDEPLWVPGGFRPVARAPPRAPRSPSAPP